MTWQQHVLCFGFGLAGMIASIFVRFLPVRWFRRINVFKEADIKENEMD